MKKQFMIAFVLFICLISFSGSFLAHAMERRQEPQTYYKYYTSIRVEPGDTLWEIAERYLCEESGSRESYIQELRQINGLNGSQIRAGQYLTVIYYSTEYK